MSDRYTDLRRAAVNAQQIPNPWVLAAYTAAAEPAVVLQLLDDLRGLRGVIRAAWDALDSDVQAVVKVAAAQQVIMDLSPVQGHPDGGSTT